MAAGTSKEIYDSHGRSYRLTKRLARGGEGTVYDLEGHSELAAKIYHNSVDEERAAKLALMVDAGTDRLLNLTTCRLIRSSIRLVAG